MFWLVAWTLSFKRKRKHFFWENNNKKNTLHSVFSHRLYPVGPNICKLQKSTPKGKNFTFLTKPASQNSWRTPKHTLQMFPGKLWVAAFPSSAGGSCGMATLQFRSLAPSSPGSSLSLLHGGLDTSRQTEPSSSWLFLRNFCKSFSSS